MSKLVAISLEDGSTVYIEAADRAQTSEGVVGVGGDVTYRGGRQEKGGGAMPKFKAIEDTIRAYTSHTLNAFKQVAAANVDKVTLEFGINVNAQGGIPYITQGSAGSSLKITVECSFPNPVPQNNPAPQSSHAE